ncbi:acyltransferase [Oxalobacteraceae bacterium]|nr:acyltransferase [Oxalobacteraceae bacterium]
MSIDKDFGASAGAPDRLHFLDGLRALAALWVMFGHAHLFVLGWNALPALAGLLLNWLLYLHLGVDIFLVLSGFCLALPVVRNGFRLSTSTAVFFAGRAVRILPPYLATLGLILLVNAFVPLARWGRHAAGLTSEIPAAELWANVLLLQDVLPQYNTINGPFWSIAAEWHLYLLFPLAVWILRRFGVLALLLAGINLAIFLSWFNEKLPLLAPNLQVSVPQPPFFVALFAMGIVAAALAQAPQFAPLRARIQRHAWQVAAGLTLPLALLLWDNRILDGATVGRFLSHVHQIDPLCGALTAALLVGLSGLAPAHWARRVLERRALVALGGFSYSLYLTHIPILAILYTVMGRYGMLTEAHALRDFFILLIGGSLLCIGFSWGFARLFERRLRRRPGGTLALAV